MLARSNIHNRSVQSALLFSCNGLIVRGEEKQREREQIGRWVGWMAGKIEKRRRRWEKRNIMLVVSVQCQWNATARFLALARWSENLGHRFANELSVLSGSRRQILIVCRLCPRWEKPRTHILYTCVPISRDGTNCFIGSGVKLLSTYRSTKPNGHHRILCRRHHHRHRHLRVITFPFGTTLSSFGFTWNHEVVCDHFFSDTLCDESIHPPLCLSYTGFAERNCPSIAPVNPPFLFTLLRVTASEMFVANGFHVCCEKISTFNTNLHACVHTCIQVYEYISCIHRYVHLYLKLYQKTVEH